MEEERRRFKRVNLEDLKLSKSYYRTALTALIVRAIVVVLIGWGCIRVDITTALMIVAINTAIYFVKDTWENWDFVKEVFEEVFRRVD